MIEIILKQIEQNFDHLFSKYSKSGKYYIVCALALRASRRAIFHFDLVPDNYSIFSAPAPAVVVALLILSLQAPEGAVVLKPHKVVVLITATSITHICSRNIFC